MATIYAEDIDFKFCHSDAGACFSGQCPECRGEIQVAECGWWDAKCECGYEWRLSITVEAEKE